MLPIRRQSCSLVCSGVEGWIAGSVPIARGPGKARSAAVFECLQGDSGVRCGRHCSGGNAAVSEILEHVQFHGRLQWLPAGQTKSGVAQGATPDERSVERRVCDQLAACLARVFSSAVRQRSSAVSSSSCICRISSSCCSSCWRRSAIICSMMFSCFWLPALGS